MSAAQFFHFVLNSFTKPEWKCAASALAFDHDETGLDDDAMGKIHFKSSSCLGQLFGDDETGLDDDETDKIDFKHSNCLGQELGERTKTKIAIPLFGR